MFGQIKIGNRYKIHIKFSHDRCCPLINHAPASKDFHKGRNYWLNIPQRIELNIWMKVYGIHRKRVDITKQNSFSGWLWWNRFNRQWIFLLLSCNAMWAMSIISRVLFCVIKHVLNNNASCSPVHFKLNFIIKQKGVSQGGNETALCMHVARLYYSHEQPDTCLHYNCSISSLLMLV